MQRSIIMEDEWKVYIKGVPNSGGEVVKVLANLGGKGDFYNGQKSNLIYFINHNGYIDCEESNSEIGKIIMDNYKEIKLPEKWKDGDLLVHTDDDGSTHYAVYKETEEFNEYTQPYSILTYISVNKHVYGINTIIFKDGWKLASDEEYKEFYELLHKHGVDWDAEKKQLIDWKWKPKMGEGYFFIDSIGEIHLGTIYSYNNKKLFDFGNCFKTKEEAKIAAKKIKKLLNAKS